MNQPLFADQIGSGSKAGAADARGEKDWDLISVGEAFIDLISAEAVASLTGAATFHAHVGGEAANVAYNVARLGGRAALVARVGADGFGERCRQHLAAAQVETAWVHTDPAAPTTLVTVARSTGTPDFVIYRGADRRLQEGDLPTGALHRARAVHASAFVLSHEPARSAVLAALRLARP